MKEARRWLTGRTSGLEKKVHRRQGGQTPLEEGVQHDPPMPGEEAVSESRGTKGNFTSV